MQRRRNLELQGLGLRRGFVLAFECAAGECAAGECAAGECAAGECAAGGSGERTLTDCSSARLSGARQWPLPVAATGR
jgi:hypothetical protein